ncbi:MAG: WYL domain-containing protein [Oligoflexales bacterium]|nr:WYL domain-containing protein [Oligoflexales bacterium]
MVINSIGPIPCETFEDPKWGCDRTMRRHFEELNHWWELNKGGPLFEIVDSDGNPAVHGDRFIKKVGGKLELDRKVETLAILPAIFQLIRNIKGTILDEEFQLVYKIFSSSLTVNEKKIVDHLSRKFYYFGKGMKNYESYKDILDSVYDALIREQLLKVTRLRDGKEEEFILRPLTLMLYNNGLFLVAQRNDQGTDEKPYHWKIESFATADSLKKQNFKYPAAYRPEDIYEGEFGIIYGDKRRAYAVQLEFADDPQLKRYVRERIWTDNDKFTDRKNGTLLMKFEVSDLTEVKAFVLSFGDSVKVLGPKELVDDVKRTLRMAVKAYR